MRKRIIRSIVASSLGCAVGCGEAATNFHAVPAAALMISPISGNTHESGHSAHFDVSLLLEPTDLVALQLSSTAVSEGTLEQRQLTFTPDNWNAPQTVTVTGVDDNVADGDAWYQIVLSQPRTADQRFATLPESRVEVLNVDDDSPGIVTTVRVGRTDESAAVGQFEVSLASQPQDEVMLGMFSSDPTELALSTDRLFFTPDNWRSPQVVSAVGVDDSVADGDQRVEVQFFPTASRDPGYATLAVAPIEFVNLDNDRAGLRVTPPSGNTQEGGGVASFQVALTTEPLAPVTVKVLCEALDEVALDREQLIFTADNWASPQTVTLQGLEDDLADGSQPVDIELEVEGSGDPQYDRLPSERLTLLNLDNDSAGIVVSSLLGSTSERGEQAQVTVSLSSQPRDTVTLVAFSSEPGEAIVSEGGTLEFSPNDWRAPRTVILTGVDDRLADGHAPYRILFSPVSSEDPDYARLRVPAIETSNLDDDTAAITVGPVTGSTGEDGAEATFAVVLNSEPLSEVTLALTSSAPSEGVVTQTQLRFTQSTWNIPQAVTVTGIDDLIADGNAPYWIEVRVLDSADPPYASLSPVRVPLFNADDDSAGLRFVGGITPSGANRYEMTVALDSEPTAPVTVQVDAQSTSTVTVDNPTLLFTPTNWRTPQVLRLSREQALTTDTAVALRFLPLVSSDPSYSGFVPSAHLFTLPAGVAEVPLPPESPGEVPGTTSAAVVVSPLEGTASESGASAQFTVQLSAPPSSVVEVPVVSTTPTESRVSPSSLRFDAANWNTPVAVIVQGLDDPLVDGDKLHRIALGPVVSLDSRFARLVPPPVLVTNADNDPGLALETDNLASVLVERGGRTSFGVALQSPPPLPVTVSVAVSDAQQASVRPTELLFTPDNWQTSQRIVVLAVDNDSLLPNPEYTVTVGQTVLSNGGVLRHSAVTPQRLNFRNSNGD